jgi:myxalamid-type polyketide synthase MxaB
MSVDTACSSSLTAIHLAVRGIRAGECEIALCGGVNLIHHTMGYSVFATTAMLSPDGECKTFDEAADGYSRSEGCGMLVLKPLSAALRDGDTVLASIRGTAVRQDGESAGLTVPNGIAQEAVMRAALADAGLRPTDIQYVEAHGTGTALGDPIEIGSIGDLCEGAPDPVLVGSLKTNLGHMECAAGVGGVVKTVLQLRDRTIYPHLNLTNPSSRIPWDVLPVTVPTEALPWSADVRRGLVNSFGFTGTLASLVLEQPPAPVPTSRHTDGVRVFALSAATEQSLDLQVAAALRHLAARPDQDFGDVCYTSTVGRAQLNHRLAVAAADRAELVRQLERYRGGRTRGGPRRTAFLFAGQGAQYAGMASGLYQRFPVFAEQLDECVRLFDAQPDTAGSLGDLLLGPGGADDPIHQTRNAQPALFAFEYALARLWMSWGVRPAALIGHSIGELAAAALADVLTLPDAVTVVAARGRLMQAAQPGRMAAVSAPVEDVRGLVDGRPDVAVAAVNSPAHCVLSGASDSLAEIVAGLGERGVDVKYLATSHAFHSPLMTEAVAAFEEVLGGVRLREPRLPVVSNVTGELARRGELTSPAYWARHLREPVRFADSVATVAARGRHVFVEIGPSSALTGLARRCVPADADHRWLTSQRRDDPGQRAIHDAVAQYYAAGLPLAWAAYHRGHERRRVDLPRYQFAERRFRLPTVDSHTDARHPLLGKETTGDAQRAAGVREFTGTLRPDQPGYLRDHVVLGKTVFPATGYVELLFAVQDAVFGQTDRPVRDIRIHEALLLDDEDPTFLRTTVTVLADGGADVTIASRPDDVPHRHVTARIGSLADITGSPTWTSAALYERAHRAGPPDRLVDEEELYAAFAGIGTDYGPEFRRMRDIEVHGDLAVGTLRGPASATAEILPPPVLDAATHAVAALADQRGYLPIGFTELRLFRKPRTARLRSLARLSDPGSDATGPGSDTADVRADLVLCDDCGPLVEVRGLTIRPVGNPAEDHRRLRYRPRWTKRALVTERSGPRHVVALHRDAGRLAALAERITAGGGTLTAAESAAEYARALARREPTDVCWFWRTATDADPRAECEANYQDLLAALDALHTAGHDPRLWLVTEGGQYLPGDPVDPTPASTLWGFGQSLWHEYPRYRVGLIDLPPRTDEQADTDPVLADEWHGAEAAEGQIAYREGHRHVRRLRPVADRTTGIELAITEYGGFGAIKPVPADDVPPRDDQIQVRVHAAGLNFKDVLNALGMLKQYDDRPLPLGFECSGTVLAAGPRAAFAVGQAVLVNAPGCLRSTVTVPSAMAVAKPERVGFAEAAGIPTVYSTAWYALHHLARVQPGDRVLIHAAAGGVGQAAVQVAKLAGAEVFATASQPKWPLLRSQGITHVMNSRTLDFAADIARITGGRGVDIVLNSLNKDFIPAGMSCLAEGGRFVEMGKVGAWTAEQAHEHRPDVDYHLFDLAELSEKDSLELGGSILRAVTEHVEAGRLSPVPTSTYTPDEVEEAFGVLSRGASVGKLVIDFAAEPDRRPTQPPAVDADHTYLITGGLGGLGVLTANALVDLGARHIALVSRSGNPAPEVAGGVRRLAERANVIMPRGDVADPADLRRILDSLAGQAPPIGGIVHAAGVLADRPVSALDRAALDTVFRPKVYGGLLLHDIAAELPELAFFVGYSSVTAVLGQAGQANYAAANAFLDDLMTRRAAAGLPALSVDWGPVAEVGMSARLAERHLRGYESRGVRLLPPRVAARELTAALGGAGPQVLIGECDWSRYAASAAAPVALYQDLVADASSGTDQVDMDRLTAAARPERVRLISGFVRATVGRVLRVDEADDLDGDAVFAELGLDSLLAVELKNALETAFRLPLPASVTADQPSVDQLVDFIDRQFEPATTA